MLVLVGCSVGHCISRCSWVSSCWPQYLHRWLSSLCCFFWLVLAASILALVLIMALHCFLASFFMYCGLVPIGVDMFSAQCFVFDLVWASFLISSLWCMCVWMQRGSWTNTVQGYRKTHLSIGWWKMYKSRGVLTLLRYYDRPLGC